MYLVRVCSRDISTENLQFLSVDQALADLAYFIKYQKNTIPGLSESQVRDNKRTKTLSFEFR